MSFIYGALGAVVIIVVLIAAVIWLNNYADNHKDNFR